MQHEMTISELNALITHWFDQLPAAIGALPATQTLFISAVVLVFAIMGLIAWATKT